MVLRKIFLAPIIGAVIAAGGCTPKEDKPTPERTEQPVANTEAAARAFKLYYRERVDRAVIAFNRFQLFGDATYAANMRHAVVARTGDEFEVIPGPSDNNLIGASLWRTWHAYKIMGSRPLALSLIRMFDGLVFFESVSGHPGLTAREVYPGWTRVMDGNAGVIELTRLGAPVESPFTIDESLAAEMLDVFYDGLRFTYRENPEDFIFSYMPGAEIGAYATTYSFSMTPDFIRVSDCCSSLKRTPAPYAWEGAYWGNHNSRDNFPDLGLGFVTALEAMNSSEADADIRAAAERAFQAGRRIGDLVESNGGKIMTVDEHNPYETLTVSGDKQPDGERDIEDLGSLSDCQTAYLARAVSTEGLTTPLPGLPLPGTVEYVISEFLTDFTGDDSLCPVPQETRICQSLEEAYCGMNWGTVDQMEIFGKPWLELAEAYDEADPGKAAELIGGFQDDFYEKTTGMMALVLYAETKGDLDLLDQARASLAGMTKLMRTYADVIYTRIDPNRLIQRYYEAALFDAISGLATSEADFADFAAAEQQMAYLESLLDFPETTTSPLLTNEEIAQIVNNRLPSRSESVQNRYNNNWDTPPIRRNGDHYEARINHPDGVSEWKEVETPHHLSVDGVVLFEALPLCTTSPDLLDCGWARLGCQRPDLDQNGTVDEDDRTIFDLKSAEFAAAGCGSANLWCGGADLDHTGAIDETDKAFIEAARGCYYAPAAEK